MTDARLKQSERLEVFRLVTSAGFDSTDFKWEEKRDQESFRSSMGGGDEVAVSVLRHSPTNYYMRFGAFAIEFSPGSDTRIDHDKHEGTWKTRVPSCTTWLQELRREVETLDLWASVGQERALANAAASDDVDNNPFTPVERQIISASLDEIKATLLSMHQFDCRQAAIIDNQFRHLDEAGQRIGPQGLVDAVVRNHSCRDRRSFSYSRARKWTSSAGRHASASALGRNADVRSVGTAMEMRDTAEVGKRGQQLLPLRRVLSTTGV